MCYMLYFGYKPVVTLKLLNVLDICAAVKVHIFLPIVKRRFP